MNNFTKKVTSIFMAFTFLYGLSLNSAFAMRSNRHEESVIGSNTTYTYIPEHWLNELDMNALRFAFAVNFPNPYNGDGNNIESDFEGNDVKARLTDSLLARRVAYALRNSAPANDIDTIRDILGEDATVQQISEVLKVLCSQLSHIAWYEVAMAKLNEVLQEENLGDDVLFVLSLSIEGRTVFSVGNVARLVQSSQNTETFLINQIRFVARFLCHYLSDSLKSVAMDTIRIAQKRGDHSIK